MLISAWRTRTAPALPFGRVVDNLGNGVPKILVRPLVEEPSFYLPLGGAFTDDEGYYTVSVDASHLRDNIYLFAETLSRIPRSAYVSPRPAPKARVVTTFYPDATTRQGATAIRRGSGFHSSFEIKLQILKTYAVTGTVSGELPGTPSEPPWVSLWLPDDEASFQASDSSRIRRDRSFVIYGVTPGTYKVMAVKGGQWPDVHWCSPLIRMGSANLTGVHLRCRSAFRAAGRH